jgi:hypothetical protein
MNNLTLLTENSRKDFKAHFFDLHDTSLKSFNYEFNHDGQKYIKNIHIKILAQDAKKQWRDQWGHWVTLYVVIENVNYLNILKVKNYTLAQLIYEGELGLMADAAFIALDSDYPSVELYSFKTSADFNFLIIGERCYWGILPYEPRGNDVPLSG